jgi:hypothetical protein
MTHSAAAQRLKWFATTHTENTRHKAGVASFLQRADRRRGSRVISVDLAER